MAIQDYLGGINIFGTPIPTGILDPKQEEKLRNQALVSGIIGTAANYLAQPKNLNAGSALRWYHHHPQKRATEMRATSIIAEALM